VFAWLSRMTCSKVVTGRDCDQNYYGLLLVD
jgi:hypothetical protein